MNSVVLFFSWDEMAKYDVPAMINFVLKKTNQSSLYYIGHSQGTLIMFAYLSQHPEFSHKVTTFLCQLTCQSADIMSSLCGVGVRVRVNNFFSKTTRPRDVLFFLKDTLSIEDEKLFKACKSVCSSVC